MDRLIGCGQKAAVMEPRDLPVCYLQLRQSAIKQGWLEKGSSWELG